MATQDPRSYVVRTFGCQMNDHDSERISGLLDADGLWAVEDEDDADVVVLNTCCIRENADNKLYGNLGMLKRWKDAREGRQIVVSGCLAQKDRDIVQKRAPWVDVVMGTHNVHRAAELLETSRVDGPLTEILEEAVLDDHAMFPSALPAKRVTSYDAWVTIQIGCDNSCAFCIVPSVRGSEISRPYADIVSEVRTLADQGVTEVTLLGQNVNSYGRDLQLDKRRAGEDVSARPLFSELLREVGAVPGIKRVRFTSPHPKDIRVDVARAMAETPADLAVIEVGLGGVLDATNVIERPLLSVITPVDYDHAEFLGTDLAGIASEKAGVLKAGDALPPERDLAVSLNVSRPSVREALIALEVEGVIEVRTGSGIYVQSLGKKKTSSHGLTKHLNGEGLFQVFLLQHIQCFGNHVSRKLHFAYQIFFAKAGIAKLTVALAYIASIAQLGTDKVIEVTAKVQHQVAT